MPIPTYTEADLAVSQKWLDEFSRALTSRGVAGGVQACITDAMGVIEAYSRAYTLPDSQWLRLMRPIAIYYVYSRSGNVAPTSVETAYRDAMKELEGIRDGKFSNLPPADPLPSETTQTGAWGSEPRIGIRIP